VAGERGDRVGRQIGSGGRPVELAAQPVAEGAIDRRVLPTGGRRRRPGGEALPGEVEVLLDPARTRAREGHAGLERLGLLPHLDEPVDELARGGSGLESLLGDDLLVRDGAAVDRQLRLGAGADQRRIWQTGHSG